MASSCVESEDSESDLEVENGSQALLEFQKTDSLKKELEEEEMVHKTLNEVGNVKQSLELEAMLTRLERVTDKLLKASFQDITNMFSNGTVFFVDGDSMLLNLMGDENYDANNGGQLLHLIYLCERHLQIFSRKGGKFEVVFFNIWNKAWSGKHPLLLARSALMSHLRFNMSCKVHEFESMWDANFKRILERCNCVFLLIDFEMMDTYATLFPNEDHIMEELIFQVSICYCLMGLHLSCVDINDVQLTVSTLNAFLCLPGAKLEHVELRKLLHNIIFKIEERYKASLISSETVASPLVRAEGERDVRRVVTVSAAAQFLKDSCAPQPQEDWIRAFLLYSSLLEVLPLKLRGCTSVGTHSTAITQFLKQLHKHMNRVLQAILHDRQTVNYSFDTVSDLWHGNLFVFVLNYVTEHGACGDGLLGRQTLTAYDRLLQDVVRLTERPLMKFPVTIQRTIFSGMTYEGKENNSTKKTTIPLSSCHDLKQLVSTNCLLTFEFCNDLLPDIKKNEHYNDTSVSITRNSNFEEKHHWHSKILLSDEYDRTADNMRPPMDDYQLKKYLRNKSKFARFMSVYGSSIEGRSESTKSIVCESGNSRKKKGSKPKKRGESAQKIIEESCRKQQAKTEESDRKLFDSFKEKYRRYKEREDYSAALSELKLLERKLKTKQVLRNVLLYMVRILWCLWQNKCKTVGVISDNLHSAKELFLVVRRILKDFESSTLSDKDSELLGRCLWQMGLGRIAQCWNLPEPSKGTTDESCSIGMSWIDFQLLHLGPELERKLGSIPDNRVEGFMPDKWQTELFDSVDKHQSVLVVAPTSSGKTYASYYCMEKVLRESNDGVVVYVAPTKALVNQVAATIYARFKNKDMPPGKSVYGVFTRDYRTNALNSQILVTVPECLALLLLSPRRHNWVRSLRYVIFDEIHCLAGQAGGGFVWECGLLLIRCPFLALSATVEDPESLHRWLQNMQYFKKMQDIKNGCEKPCDFYTVNLVVYRDRHADLRKHVYCEDGEFHHIHPYAYLDRTLINEEGGVPKSITLSPEEVHALYIAMNSVCPQDPRLRELHPEVFFSACTNGFISRNIVRDYEAELKRLLESWATEEGTALESVTLQLRTVTEPLGNVSEMRFIQENFINFVQKLKEQNMLPAIVFSYNRSLISSFFGHATEYYEDVAEKYEDSKKESKSVDGKRSGKDDEMQKRNPKDNRADNVDIRDFRVTRITGRNKYEASLNLLRSESAYPGSIRGVGHADEKVIEFIEHRLMTVGYKQGSIFPRGLSMGIGMHHGGLNAKERSAVEMLFRMKLLNLVFATGTLALGIHMPCKTVAVVGDSPYLNPLEFQQMSGRAGRRGFDIAGNVVFMGLNERKMRMLLTGKLPRMVGNFPLNVTMVLRLLLMVNDITCDGTHSEEVTRDALSRALTLLNCCLVYQTFPELKVQMKHFFAFSTQLLMLQGLLDDEGNPQLFTGIITHLYYHEPGNLAFVYLMKSGALRKLCTPEKDGRISKETQMNLVIVLSYLFAPLILHNTAQDVEYNNSKVVLPPLPPEIGKVLEMYNEEVMCVYDSYFRIVAKDCAENVGDDDTLPMSGIRVGTKDLFEPSTEGPMSIEKYIVENCKPRTICSAFAALSGHTDRGLYSHYNMISNIRHQVFTDVKVAPIVELHRTYNGYAWDFYNHGIVAAIQDDNGLKQGQDFTLLNDFLLMLKAIKTSLSELEPVDENDQVLRTFSIVEEKFNYSFWKAYGHVQKI